MKRLRHGEWIAGFFALALFGVLFLDWFRLAAAVSGTTDQGAAFDAVFSREASGWSSLGWLALGLCDLAILAGIALVLVSASQESPVLPVLAAICSSLFGILGTFALLIQLIAQPEDDSYTAVKAGWWLGLVCVMGIAIGGWLAMRDDRTPNARERPIEVRPVPPVEA